MLCCPLLRTTLCYYHHLSLTDNPRPTIMTRSIRVIIIGGGISGIAQAIRLQDELGHHLDLTVSGVGACFQPATTTDPPRARSSRDASPQAASGATRSGPAQASTSQSTYTASTRTSSPTGRSASRHRPTCSSTGRASSMRTACGASSSSIPSTTARRGRPSPRRIPSK